MIWLGLMAVTFTATLVAVWGAARWMRWKMIRGGIPVRDRQPSKRPIKGDLWMHEQEYRRWHERQRREDA